MLIFAHIRDRCMFVSSSVPPWRLKNWAIGPNISSGPQRIKDEWVCGMPPSNLNISLKSVGYCAPLQEWHVKRSNKNSWLIQVSKQRSVGKWFQGIFGAKSLPSLRLEHYISGFEQKTSRWQKLNLRSSFLQSTASPILLEEALWEWFPLVKTCPRKIRPKASILHEVRVIFLRN